MLSAALTWLTTQGIGVILGALAGFARDAINDYRNAQAQKEVGQLTVERDQARAGEAAQETIAEAAAKRVSDDDALGRLDKGDA